MDKDKIDGSQAPSEIDLTTLSQEELLEFAQKANKKATDQESARKKLEDKLKVYKEKETPTEDEGTPSEKRAPEKEDTEEKSQGGLSTAEVRLVNKGYSDEEIDAAKRYAQAFNMKLGEAVDSAGFKAQLQETRETNKSGDMSIDDISTLNVSMSDEEFMTAVQAGEIDVTSGKNRERALKLAKAEIAKART